MSPTAGLNLNGVQLCSFSHPGTSLNEVTLISPSRNGSIASRFFSEPSSGVRHAPWKGLLVRAARRSRREPWPTRSAAERAGHPRIIVGFEAEIPSVSAGVGGVTSITVRVMGEIA
jgi:hypothetical protein